MDLFPQLDIQADLENLDSDTEEGVSVVISEDLSAPLDVDAPMDRIFIGKPTNGKKISKPINKKKVKLQNSKIEQIGDHEFNHKTKRLSEIEEEEIEDVPTKPPPLKKEKKPLSEKQKAHLARIRVLAQQKKAAKKAAKEEALAKVNEEHKAKAVYKKRTKKINEEIPPVPEPIDKVSKEFQKRVVKEDPEKIKKQQWEAEEKQFIRFMTNMEKYEKVKAGYLAHQKAEEDKKKKIELKKQQEIAAKQKKTQVKHQQKKPVQGIPPILKPPSENPYKDIFSW